MPDNGGAWPEGWRGEIPSERRPPALTFAGFARVLLSPLPEELFVSNTAAQSYEKRSAVLEQGPFGREKLLAGVEHSVFFDQRAEGVRRSGFQLDGDEDGKLAHGGFPSPRLAVFPAIAQPAIAGHHKTPYVGPQLIKNGPPGRG